jgi:hypothetical protein
MAREGFGPLPCDRSPPLASVTGKRRRTCTARSTPLDTRGALDLDRELGKVADTSTPRAPVNLPFTSDEMKSARAYGGAVWRNENMEDAGEERVWVDDDDSDATLPIEGEYAYATEEAQRLLLRAPDAART